MTARLPAGIRAALAEVALPWSIEPGGRHQKLRVAGKLVGVLKMGGRSAHPVAERNLIAAIRRIARQPP